MGDGRAWWCPLAGVLGLAILGSGAASGQNSAATRPNVLLIVVDDQSPLELQIYNPASTLQTPSIDRLAATGVIIDAAHHMGSWSGAVCTPSRHMIMSGRSLWHIPGRPRGDVEQSDGVDALVPADLAEHTLAAVFNRAGYDTMRTCKQGNSYEAANRQFTVRRDATKREGTEQGGSAWHAERVLDYLRNREQRADRDPFLIYFGFSHPHDPRNGTPELLAKYGAQNHTDRDVPPPADPRQPALPENYLSQHPFDIGHPQLRDEVAVSGVWKRRDEQTIRNELGRQFACSENIDIQIGRVLDALESMGELERTLVIYTSDHGIAIGRHGLQGKQNLYEHTWKVPLVVSGPGIPQGKRAQGNVYLMDLLATLCDLCSIDPPATNEGVSFREVLEGRRDAVREVLYGVYCGGTKPGIRCVKVGDWKLIEYDVLDGQVRETQLFNLASNPAELLQEHQADKIVRLTGHQPRSEQRDLAEDPAYAERLAEMRRLLATEMSRWDDPYRLWYQQPGTP